MDKNTKVNVVLKNPEAMTILCRYIKDFGQDPRLKMAGRMTLEQLLRHAPGLSTEYKQAIYAELAKVIEENNYGPGEA